MKTKRDRLSGKETDRDPAGRFAPGNRGGPGRPRRAVEADYVRAVAGAVTPERIAGRVADRAEAGDPAALAWLGRWLLERSPSLGDAHAAELRERLDGVEAVMVRLAREVDDAAPGDPLEALTEDPADKHARVLELARLLADGLDGAADPEG